MLVIMWYTEGSAGHTACQAVDGIATPWWLSAVDWDDRFQLNSSANVCHAQVWDGRVCGILTVLFLGTDAYLFMPSLWEQCKEKPLKQIVDEDIEFLEKRATLSRNLVKRG
jgi:hypothetical protein